jgi:uncharacterized membrane protein YoaK (UPF0700 family)
VNIRESLKLAQRARRRHHQVGVALVAALALLAGMTDAVGFLSTGDYVSFMSGNTTRLAVALSEGHGATAGRLGLAILTFVLGNALGVVLSRASGRRTFPVLFCIAALLAAVAAWPTPEGLPALLLGILAMGMVNAAVEQVSGLPIGLTYVTGALSRFGRGLGHWLMGERRGDWHIQAVPWLGMLAGGVIGALLQQHLGLRALLASSLLAAALGVAFLLLPRRWQLRYLAR